MRRGIDAMPMPLAPPDWPTSRPIRWGGSLAGIEVGQALLHGEFSYDGAGNLIKSYESIVGSPYSHTGRETTYSYHAIGEAYRQTRTFQNWDGHTATSYQAYDAQGHLTALTQSNATPDNPSRKIYTNGAGQVLLNQVEGKDTPLSNRQSFVLVNCEQVARLAGSVVLEHGVSASGRGTKER